MPGASFFIGFTLSCFVAPPVVAHVLQPRQRNDSRQRQTQQQPAQRPARRLPTSPASAGRLAERPAHSWTDTAAASLADASATNHRLLRQARQQIGWRADARPGSGRRRPLPPAPAGPRSAMSPGSVTSARVSPSAQAACERTAGSDACKAAASTSVAAGSAIQPSISMALRWTTALSLPVCASRPGTAALPSRSSAPIAAWRAGVMSSLASAVCSGINASGVPMAASASATWRE